MAASDIDNTIRSGGSVTTPERSVAPVLTRVLDAATRAFWRVAGGRLDLHGEHAWLEAPRSEGSAVADAWLDASVAAWGGSVREAPGDGLLPDLACLDGPGFAAADLHPEVRSFYEYTSSWRMEVWTQWNPLFAPGGEIVSRLFGRPLPDRSGGSRCHLSTIRGCPPRTPSWRHGRTPRNRGPRVHRFSRIRGSSTCICPRRMHASADEAVQSQPVRTHSY